MDNGQQESELTEEFAGNASAFTPLSQTDADYWTADSGASIHMTFRRDWIIGLVPDRRRVELADGSVVYSAGISSIKFIAWSSWGLLLPWEMGGSVMGKFPFG
jgi:hypothetical protein